MRQNSCQGQKTIIIAASQAMAGMARLTDVVGLTVTTTTDACYE
jgi:hypothetical protein